MFADGMGPPRLAVTAQQSVFASFDKDESDGMHTAEMLQERGQFLELIAFASVDEKRGTRKAAVAGGVEFSENRNQLDGKIVDAIKTHVLEGVQDRAFSGARQAGENDELAGFRMIG